MSVQFDKYSDDDRKQSLLISIMSHLQLNRELREVAVKAGQRIDISWGLIIPSRPSQSRHYN